MSGCLARPEQAGARLLCPFRVSRLVPSHSKKLHHAQSCEGAKESPRLRMQNRRTFPLGPQQGKRGSGRMTWRAGLTSHPPSCGPIPMSSNPAAASQPQLNSTALDLTSLNPVPLSVYPSVLTWILHLSISTPSLP